MAEESTVFALLRSRYGAFMIDALLFLVLWFMGALAVGSVGLESGRWNALALLAAYFGLLPATPLRGTPGKRACGIRITDLQGRPPGVLRCVARFAASVPSIGLFGVGFLPAAWTRRRQALHDLIAGTLVVRADAPAEAVAGAAAPTLSWLGRIAACLVVVSSGLAVYLNVQLYDAILVREGFSEMWTTVGAYQAQVAEALLRHTPMPAPAKSTRHVKSLRVNGDGTVVLEPSSDLADNGRFVFTPTLDGAQVTWKCSASGIKPPHLPYSCKE